MTLTPEERIAYSAIVDRPPLVLPDGLRLIVWPIVNLEVWQSARPMARQVLPAPTGRVLVPDIPNWAWHEYGMRVGYWRFKAAFDARGITPTLSINADVCNRYERVAASAAVASGLRQWRAMAVASVGGAMPCGACRQFLAEFGLQLTLIMADVIDGNRTTRTLAQLLPDAFDESSLINPTRTVPLK